MTKLKTLKRDLLNDPEVRAEYDARTPEYELVSALIAARKKAGLTQEQVAKRMGTKQAAIARIEGGRQKPSFNTIERYAEATGHRAVVNLVPA
jgi:DNA-binding XRE family transcriptional regulator